jgi:hypothetical protein
MRATLRIPNLMRELPRRSRVMFAVWASPLDAERVPDDLGGSVRVVAVDRLRKKVGHVYAFT